MATLADFDDLNAGISLYVDIVGNVWDGGGGGTIFAVVVAVCGGVVAGCGGGGGGGGIVTFRLLVVVAASAAGGWTSAKRTARGRPFVSPSEEEYPPVMAVRLTDDCSDTFVSSLRND